MPKLHQIVAVESSEKTRFERTRTKIYNGLDKDSLFKGMVRKYRPIEEDGDELPDERQEVQLTAQEAIKKFETATSRLIDLTATKDYGNAVARADVKVGDTVIIKDAPVPFLLFLEKQLVDLETFIRRMPTLDRARRWTHDENTGLYESEPEERRSTSKVQKPIVLYDATPEHPAQTQLVTEDVLQGIWTIVNYHGGIKELQREKWLDRVAELRVAVKAARCEANDTEVEQQKVAQKLFDYVFL